MDKYIFIKRKVLSKDYCEHLIRVLEKSELHDNIRGYKFMDADLLIDKFSFIRDKLVSVLQEYRKKHPFLIKRGMYINPDFMIKKFFPGNYYGHSIKDVSKPEDGEHMEHGSSPDDCKRILAWMFYLNDIKRAGGTCWPQQNFISKPREGDLYIWPAGWTHSHYGIPAPQENKYFMSGWCSLHE
tara:strand:- start:55 stop:606 length:552 start_codon:yes stop_codon:yes gene_type:complete